MKHKQIKIASILKILHINSTVQLMFFPQSIHLKEGERELPIYLKYKGQNK